MTELPHYRSLAAHYEACLERHGDTPQGVDWPDADGAATRYEVMLDVIRQGAGEDVSLLDVGCGASHLYEHIQAHGPAGVRYAGLDISEAFVALSRQKHPSITYWCVDLLAGDVPALPRFDYAVMNGVFTERVGLDEADMWEFMRRLVERVFDLVDVGLAFNVMSKQVDWERDDLFHVPMDELAGWLTANVSRSFTLRHDYGLYEYTAYVYR